MSKQEPTSSYKSKPDIKLFGRYKAYKTIITIIAEPSPALPSLALYHQERPGQLKSITGVSPKAQQSKPTVGNRRRDFYGRQKLWVRVAPKFGQLLPTQDQPS